MILDKIENINIYNIDTEVELSKILEYLKLNKKVPEGKFVIKDDELFGIGLKYETKAEKDCMWEAHRKYVDIHYIIKGQENIQVSDIEHMKATNEYHIENDYQLFEGTPQQNLLLQEGDVLVLFPNEVHKTAVMIDKTNSLQKIVFKLKIR